MMAENLATFLDGGRMAFCLIIAVCFVKLGRSTGDRLYHAFAAAFVLLAIGSTLIGLHSALGDYSAIVVVPRLIAFVIIILAIIDKNRRGASRSSRL